jgi:hypothetical protein
MSTRRHTNALLFLMSLCFLIVAGQALADTGMMPGTQNGSVSSDFNLVETLYPEVMPDSPDPFKSEAIRKPWLLAHVEGSSEAGVEEGEPMDPKCVAFAADPDANLGEVINAGCKPTLSQMSALMDNPLGNVAMLFTQFDFYVKKDPATGREDTQYNYMGIAQFPKKLNDNWNLINRVIWNVGSVPLDQDKIDEEFGSIPGGGELLPPGVGGPLPIDLFSGRTTGFGDMMYVALFAPSSGNKCGKTGGTCLWGLGFDLGLPTATEDILGTGKYTAGPSALGVYIGSKWKYGALVTHFKDFASRDKDRAGVNVTNLQYLWYYSLSDTFSIGAAPNIIINWEQSSGNKVTVPLGIGFNSTVNIGKVPVRFGAELHYSVVTPDDVLGTKWDFRFYIIPAAPSALFSFMN